MHAQFDGITPHNNLNNGVTANSIAKYVVLVLVCIFIFEVGSLVCGLSANVDQLIAGRTVSSVGAADIFLAMVQIVAQVTWLEDRPRLWCFGAIFGLASVIGLLVGSAYTDLLALAKRIDFSGRTSVALSKTCLSLALQWGGNTKLWSDKDIIICFVFSVAIAAAFIFWDICLHDHAMVPSNIFKSRSIYATVISFRFSAAWASARHAELFNGDAGRIQGRPKPRLPVLLRGFVRPVLWRHRRSWCCRASVSSELTKNLPKYAPLAPAAIVKESPTAIHTNISAELIPGVVLLYCEILKVVFIVCEPIAILGLVSPLFIQKIKIEKMTPKPDADAGTSEKECGHGKRDRRRWPTACGGCAGRSIH
ncbi:hypothetical protein FIBSPDRAFT_946029 [Athelia psychrophila]|uniref:Uncharacterized protein n=1 Tax=Athelia psychrophila TaxID=1759441 RepID=A0A166T819_9AGAM|nr:hypothetical protein FIBSPDRAFT_946029 [Fibularhizoctonia sp. CBS 109695]